MIFFWCKFGSPRPKNLGWSVLFLASRTRLWVWRLIDVFFCVLLFFSCFRFLLGVGRKSYSLSISLCFLLCSCPPPNLCPSSHLLQNLSKPGRNLSTRNRTRTPYCIDVLLMHSPHTAGWQDLACDHPIPHTRLAEKWSKKGPKKIGVGRALS